MQDRAHLAPVAEAKKAGRAIWDADAMPMPPLETGSIAAFIKIDITDFEQRFANNGIILL